MPLGNSDGAARPGGRETLSSIPLDRLEVLIGLFEPEREALRAELLAARDDAQACAGQIARVKRDYPGLADWMDMLPAGQSAIAEVRKETPP